MSEWRVYGCGSASSSRSLQSSYEWVEEHFRLQIDFGYGALYRRCGAFGAIEKALNSITHLFLSHGHPDHIADVSRLVIALKYTPGYTHSLPIHLYGTKPTLQCLKDYLDHVGLEDAMDEIFEPHFLHEHDAVEVSGHTLHAIPAYHREGAIGLRIHSPQGRKIAYAGDTGPFEGQEEDLRDLDLLVIEASFLHTVVETHMTVEQAAQLAGVAQPKALAPVHFYPEIEKCSNEEIRSMISQSYKGDVFPAHDGRRLIWDASSSMWKESDFIGHIVNRREA